MAYKDPTPISPSQIDYDKSKIDPQVANYTKQVREKMYGEDTREAMARAEEISSVVSTEAKEISVETKGRQDILEQQFDDQIANMTLEDPSSAEIVAAQTNRKTGENWQTIGNRLDEENNRLTTQLATLERQKADQDYVDLQFATKVSNINFDAYKTYLESRINALTDGFKEEAFPTLNDLRTKYPNGAAGLYVVREDNYWYFWMEGSGWTAGGKVVDAGVADYSISPSKIQLNSLNIEQFSKPFLTIMHKESVQINYQTRKITVIGNSGLWVYSESTAFQIAAKGVEIDFSDLSLSTTDYNSYFLYLDRADGNILKITNASQCPNRSYVLARVYQSQVIGNQEGIKVIDSSGNVVNRYSGTVLASDISIYQGMDIGYIYRSNAIDIRASEKKITWTEGNATIIGTNTAINWIPGGTYDYSSDTDNTSYIRMLYFDVSENAFKVKKFGSRIKGKNLVFICLFYGTGATATIVSPFTNTEKRIKVDGLTYDQRTGETNYDWTNNRFLFPTNLYLLKEIEYSISAQQFNYKKFIDEDKLKFELITPTSLITFEDSASFNSPVEVNLDTRVVGMYNSNKNDALFKNLTLRFADPSKAVNISPIVLMIGDSITHAMTPAYTSWWLKQFGFTPTFIGTQNNNHDYGLGIIPEITIEKGEGLGGRRITDFTGTTKRTDGTIKLAWTPFVNPDTGQFDFAYYMRTYGFSRVDYIVIQLGTNDIIGFHNSQSTDDIYNPTIEEICEYMPVEYQKMIDSIHAFDPNIKIGFNTAPPSGIDNNGFNDKVAAFTETLLYNFDGKQNNVYCLASYLSNAPLSGKQHGTADTGLTPVSATNNTKRGAISTDVHDAQTNTMLNTLWTASWIVNRESSI